jgi:hypothetical protein
VPGDTFRAPAASFSFPRDIGEKIDELYFSLPDIPYINKNSLAFHTKKTY